LLKLVAVVSTVTSNVQNSRESPTKFRPDTERSAVLHGCDLAICFTRGSRPFQPLAPAKKLPRPAECLFYSLRPSGVLAENHPKNRGFVGILRGQKCLRRGQKCLKRRFFTAISRWRVVSRRALDASGF